jgi:hypothetical protein
MCIDKYRNNMTQITKMGMCRSSLAQDRQLREGPATRAAQLAGGLAMVMAGEAMG